MDSLGKSAEIDGDEAGFVVEDRPVVGHNRQDIRAGHAVDSHQAVRKDADDSADNHRDWEAEEAHSLDSCAVVHT